ncbi:MAG: hypothetical protein IIA41_14490, partial [SAR324 cluster bacterium]|nr:hypothetical protein [SAR324 cluster bacterium]
IVVLEAGRVAQMGSHAELTAAEGNYRTAWLLQTDRGEVPLAPGGDPARPA